MLERKIFFRHIFCSYASLERYLFSELSWQLHLLEDGYFSRKHHGYCGVYRLIGLTCEGDLATPATLNRICAQDTTGTLYIGQAGSLSDRLNQMRRRRATHNTLDALTPALAERFPATKRAVALLFTSLPDAGAVERDLLGAYRNTFGDMPPLNLRG